MFKMFVNRVKVNIDIKLINSITMGIFKIMSNEKNTK